MTSFKALMSNFCRTVPLVSTDHKHHILQALHQQQLAGILCDVCIVIEHEKIPAHKAVLAASSKYFSALFETGQVTDNAGSKAGNVREIVLSSVPQSTFFPILHFMYTSALHMFKENVNDILNTARKLQIASIVKMCTKISEDGVVLPSLKDSEQFGGQRNDDCCSKKNDVLYVDLGLCDDVHEDTSVQSSKQYDSGQSASQDLGSGSETAIKVIGHQPLVQSSSVSNSLEVSTELPGISTSSVASLSAVGMNPVYSETPRRPVGFSCSQCQKSFKKKANLKRHVLIKHSSLHKFVCSKCGKRYAIEQSLQYHISTSKCSKKFSPQHQSSSSIIQPSIADSHMSILMNTGHSDVTNIPGYLDNDTMIDSGMDTLDDSNILHQSLVSVNPGDSLSLVIPPTTLFPSLANIHEESLSSNFNHLDALNNITTDQSISSSSIEPKETFMCSSSSFPSYEDGGGPMIRCVQRVKDVTNFPFSEIAVNHNSTLSECDANSSETLVETTSNISAADTTSTTRDCLEIGNNGGDAAKLIRIAPKTPLMMPLRRQQKHKLSSGREKVPVVVRSPIDISSLSTCLDMNCNPDESRCIAPCETGASCTSESSSKSSRDSTEFNVVGKCLVCGRAFHSTDALIYHKRKCCKCPFCHRIFSQFSNMKRHVGIFHTKLKPHECNICGRAYGIKQSLRFHMEAKHGITHVTRKYNRNVAKLSKDASQSTT